MNDNKFNRIHNSDKSNPKVLKTDEFGTAGQNYEEINNEEINNEEVNNEEVNNDKLNTKELNIEKLSTGDLCQEELSLKGFKEMKAGKELIDKTVGRILSRKTTGNITGLARRTISIAASLILLAGVFGIYYSWSKGYFGIGNPFDKLDPGINTPKNNSDDGSSPDSTASNGTSTEAANPDEATVDGTPVPGGALQIPAIELPKNTNGAVMDMIGLIVYKGRIYTQTGTDIDPEKALGLIGEKLGTTKGNIDEWSSQDEYAKEFASTIGQLDVYTVKGYDQEFRLMTYMEYDGEAYTEFYECLNGITVDSGSDIFGKLKISGNVVNAWYRSFSDWNSGINDYRAVTETDLLNRFADELNNTIPYSYDSIRETIYQNRNDESYRALTLELRDGSMVNLILYKDGYIHYGRSYAIFKMDNAIFQEFWSLLKI